MDGTGVNLFVEINSYAIALVFFLFWEEAGVTRWGLFLVRGGSSI